MASFTIRDLSDQLLANIRQQADNEGRSIQEMLRRLLENTYSNRPDAVIGWLRLDRWGEIDERDEPDDAYATCTCGEPIDPANAWVQVIADGRVIGPVCEGCATSA